MAAISGDSSCGDHVKIHGNPRYSVDTSEQLASDIISLRQVWRGSEGGGGSSEIRRNSRGIAVIRWGTRALIAEPGVSPQT
ncbi:hypothetical protein Sjap_023615 [Stephania japonica]|uniref:Uncharacterized protein n=1 Tax=Stephania japonica TaxID=461633 RepID=A0AAP0EH69_9MAGN